MIVNQYLLIANVTMLSLKKYLPHVTSALNVLTKTPVTLARLIAAEEQVVQLYIPASAPGLHRQLQLPVPRGKSGVLVVINVCPTPRPVTSGKLQTVVTLLGVVAVAALALAPVSQASLTVVPWAELKFLAAATPVSFVVAFNHPTLLHRVAGLKVIVGLRNVILAIACSVTSATVVLPDQVYLLVWLSVLRISIKTTRPLVLSASVNVAGH